MYIQQVPQVNGTKKWQNLKLVELDTLGEIAGQVPLRIIEMMWLVTEARRGYALDNIPHQLLQQIKHF
jgi:hypothetical protein